MENLAFGLVLVVGLMAVSFSLVNERNNRYVKQKNRVRKA